MRREGVVYRRRVVLLAGACELIFRAVLCRQNLLGVHDSGSRHHDGDVVAAHHCTVSWFRAGTPVTPWSPPTRITTNALHLSSRTWMAPAVACRLTATGTRTFPLVTTNLDLNSPDVSAPPPVALQLGLDLGPESSSLPHCSTKRMVTHDER